MWVESSFKISTLPSLVVSKVRHTIEELLDDTSEKTSHLGERQLKTYRSLPSPDGGIPAGPPSGDGSYW
jgi:hypothetical protein